MKTLPCLIVMTIVTHRIVTETTHLCIVESWWIVVVFDDADDTVGTAVRWPFRQMRSVSNGSHKAISGCRS